jgi:membrane associated rhomboid family serine protease
LPDNQPSYAGRPSVCRNCGALIGAGETSCHVCGSPLVAAKAALPAHQHYAMNYARAVLSRPYVFTIVFLMANVFIFLLMWGASGTQTSVLWSAFPEEVLLAYGAKTNYWIHHGHQYWRFVTPIFIHVNLIHLLVNMYALWVIGPWVEKLYGSAKFVVFWVATGIAGVVASYLTYFPGSHPGLIGRFLIKTSDGPSVGASGAVFGLIGVLFVFGLKYRRELPEGFKRAFGTGMLPVILLNIGIGFAASGFIDNAAHMGGLLSGAVFAAFVSYKRPGVSTGVTIAWRGLQVAALVLVVGSFFLATRAHRQNPGALSQGSTLPSTRGTQALVAYDNFQAFIVGEAALVKALNDGDPGGIDQAIAQLDKQERLNDETDALRQELKALLGRARKHANDSQPPRKMTPAVRSERETLIHDLKLWQQQYASWLDSICKNFDLKCSEPTPGK